ILQRLPPFPLYQIRNANAYRGGKKPVVCPEYLLGLAPGIVDAPVSEQRHRVDQCFPVSAKSPDAWAEIVHDFVLSGSRRMLSHQGSRSIGKEFSLFQWPSYAARRANLNSLGEFCHFPLTN